MSHNFYDVVATALELAAVIFITGSVIILAGLVSGAI